MSTDVNYSIIIKAALRKAYPSAKFSVTDNGSRIKWTDDGPTVEQVKATLLTVDGVTSRLSWNDVRYLYVRDDSIWLDCYNTAKREADEQERARRIEESEQRRKHTDEVVRAAREAKLDALAGPGGRRKRPSADQPWPVKPIVETAPQAFEAFEELRQRAERDVSASANDSIERSRRPSCGWPLIVEGELKKACLELKLLTPDDSPIMRLWAQFADPKKRGTVLREQLSTLTLPGIVCRGFELHAGAERGHTSDILFEAQLDKDGSWRFGPRPYTSNYHSIHASKWEEKVREREQLQNGSRTYMSPDEISISLQRVEKEIAEIDALDQVAAAKFYRRQQLRLRVLELAHDRVLDFAGSPGVQMAMASRLWGHCFNCGKALTDPISLERGIGPECLQGKIASAWWLHDHARDVATIGRVIGMPKEFVTATLAAPRPQPRKPLRVESSEFFTVNTERYTR